VTSWLHWGAATWLIVDALAVYRLARLIARDGLTKRVRRRMIDRYEGPLVELVSCPWCLSVYFAAGAVVLTYFVPYAWSFIASGLAMSAVAGFLAERE